MVSYNFPWGEFPVICSLICFFPLKRTNSDREFPSQPAGPSWQALVCWLVFVRSWTSIPGCWRQWKEDINTPFLLDGTLPKIVSAIGWVCWWQLVDFNSLKEASVLLRMRDQWNLGYQPISASWFHISGRFFGMCDSTTFQSMRQPLHLSAFNHRLSFPVGAFRSHGGTPPNHQSHERPKSSFLEPKPMVTWGFPQVLRTPHDFSEVGTRLLKLHTRRWQRPCRSSMRIPWLGRWVMIWPRWRSGSDELPLRCHENHWSPQCRHSPRSKGYECWSHPAVASEHWCRTSCRTAGIAHDVPQSWPY